MKPVKARAKTEDGEWVHGYPLIDGDKCRIFELNHKSLTATGFYIGVAVIPETIGFFTGLNDKNGGEIYEDDILRISVGDAMHFNNAPSISTECVEYIDGCFGVVYGTHRDFIRFSGFHKTTFEVIGNIHDNYEYLK